MVRTGSKLPSFCLIRIIPHVRVRSPSSIQLKLDADDHSAKNDQKTEISGSVGEVNCGTDHVEKPGAVVIGRKIMIVVDQSIEAKNALQWALTHTVQNHDIVVLLFVKKASNSKQGEEPNKEKARKVPDFMRSMRDMCQLKKPEVQVEIAVVEGKEKGATIVEEAKKQEVVLLVLGQKKRSMMTWRLLMTWMGNRVGGGGVVEYCIQNATCMVVAVRRKSKKVGGYLITTKRQKDFWLLA